MLCLALLLGLAAPATAQTPSCSASDTAVTEAVSGATARATLATECAALLDLYSTIRGTAGMALNWATTLNMEDWEGITLTSGRVTRVGVDRKNFNGTISSSIATLTELTNLLLEANEIGGSIPDLSALTKLEYVQLTTNKLTGTINANHLPASLVSLQLGDNELSGSFPDLSKFTNLQQLGLHQNNLTGNVSTLSSSNLSTVTRMYINQNRLSGEVPDLNHMTELDSLFISDNNFTGDFPALNPAAPLRRMLAHRNRLSGSLPDFSAFDKLRDLVLSDNEFSGTINASHLPEETLRDLYLHRNKLTGSLPSMNAFTKLRYFYVHGNQLSGALPTTWDALTSLQQLHLAYNSFTGAIPSGLDDLDALVHLSLCETNLDSSATLPTDLETRRTAGTLTLFKCIWIDDAEAAEGTAIQFTVDYNIFPLKGSSSETDLQLSYETEDITATDGSDYTGTSSGSVTIPAITSTTASSSSATFSVQTTADSVAEPDETFIVRLGDLPNGMAGRGSAVGKIQGTTPGCSAAQSTVLNTNSIRVLENGGMATYCVRLPNAPSGTTTVTIDRDGANRWAANFSPATLTFTASDYMTPQQVTVTGADEPNTHRNRPDMRLTHTANGGGYSSQALGNVQVSVDDAPEVEAWDLEIWDVNNFEPRQRPKTIKATRGFKYLQNDMTPVMPLYYSLRMSNRPSGTVTVTATSSDFTKFGLALKPYGTPKASLTLTFEDREADPGCHNGQKNDKFERYGLIEASNGRVGEDRDNTPDTSWRCYRRIWIISTQDYATFRKGCSDITHTATGGGVRSTAIETIRAHAVAGTRFARYNAPGRDCRLITEELRTRNAPATAAPAPTEKISNLQVTEVDATSVSVTWDAVANATSYDVSWSAESSDSLNASAGAESVTGTSATIQHDASVPMTLTVTVTPEYIDKNGVTQQLNELAGTATLAVGPSGQRLDSGGGTNGGNGGSIDSGEGAVDLPVPVSHWRFEYDAVDWVGSSHGTEKGGVAFEANEDGEGVDDHALSLDGSDDYVDLSTHVSDFPLGDSTRSVTGWFKADAGNQRQTFFTYGPNVAGKRFSIAADRTQVLVAVSGHAWGVNGLNLSEGWHHIAVTYAGGDSDDILIYLDGELQSASTLVGSPKRLDTQTGPAAIGRNVGGTKHYTGLIDDVRLYDVALSAEQVLALFEEHPQTPLVEDNLDEPEPSEQSIEADDEEADDVEVDLPDPVSHWSFDNDAVDGAGSSHGTVSGGAAFVANEDGEGVGSHALSLDGSNDYVDLDLHVSNFPLGDSARSITGWFRADTGNQGQSFFSYGPNVAGKRFSIAADRTQALVGVSGHGWGVNGLELQEGWHHVAVTYAGGKSDAVLIYLDGELQSASTLVGSPKRLNTGTGPAAIGQNVGGTKHYAGSIDDVRLYDVALSAEQVRALFDEHPQL